MEKKFSVILEKNGDVYLDLGAGGVLMGNTLENATRQVGNMYEVDLDMVDCNLMRIMADVTALISGNSATA